VRHLLDTNWRVVIADIRPEAYEAVQSSLDAGRHMFVRTDVASWESQAALFKEAFAWSGGRIDFLAANAGMAEREQLLETDLDAEPTKPEMVCTEVNQFGVFYGLKLFVYYARRTRRQEAAAAAADGAAFNPKVVITSSCSALYSFPVVVQYVATKAALLALVRSVGASLFASDNIAVNCIMPAYVDTNMTPPGVTALWPKEWITPVSTMVRAYRELTDEEGRVAPDGQSDGVDRQIKAGQGVECVVDKLYYRRHALPYADESQRFLVEQSWTPDGVWARGIMASAKANTS
jgi:NAD(P)-dependent dehydrogenase (short-subunit alcohol dehydrogenase family)